MKVIKTVTVEEEVEVRPLHPGERLKEGDVCRLNCDSHPPGRPVNAPAGTIVEGKSFYYRPIEIVSKHVTVLMDFRELEDHETLRIGDYHRHKQDDINRPLVPYNPDARTIHPIDYFVYYRPVKD